MLTPEEKALMDSWGLRGEYQPGAIAALFLARRGIVVLPAGAGKTIVGARAIELCLGRVAVQRRVLWIANTREQCQQARAALALIDPRTAEGHDFQVHCYAGVDPAAEWLARTVDYVVVDECHHAAAPSVAAIIDACTGAKRVWGLTATPERADEETLERGIEEIIGPILYRCPRQELEREGHLTAATVHFLAPNVKRSIQAACEPSDEEVQKALAKVLYIPMNQGRGRDEIWREVKARLVHKKAKEIGISNNPERDAAIVATAARHVAAGDSVLVIVWEKKHGQRLCEHIGAGRGERVEFVSADTAKGKRARIIDGFRSGEVRCLIATSLADEGMDCPRANVLIKADGGKSSRKSEQQTGRVLRAFAGKERGIVYDFHDHQHTMLEGQSKKRAADYRALGYEVVMPEEMARRAARGPIARAASADMFGGA